MSSHAGETGASEGRGATVAHSPPTGESPVAKRVHLEEKPTEENTRTEEDERVKAAAKVVSEADVGIVAYVNGSLAPIKGGTIKQRFSDFHVREVSKDGAVCQITSLYPPTKEQGGTGLYEFMKQQEEEEGDSTGELLKQRREREAAARSAKEDEARKEVERKWEWDMKEEDEIRLKELIGESSTSKLKDLFGEGPHGWKKEGEGSSIASSENQAAEGGDGQNDSRGSARGGRGGRGRSGRGGGRGGSDRQGQADPRSVHTRALQSKEERTAVHQLIRELFQGNFTTDTHEAAKDDPSTEKINTIRIRWMSKDPKRLMLDQRGHHKQDANPPYIHFLMQKSNRENQDAMNMLARSLGLIRAGVGGSKALRDLSVAGTKDKRAVTVQKVAFRRGRREIDDVWKMLNGVGKPSEGGGRGGRGGFRGGRQNGGGKPKSAMDAIKSRGDRGIRVGHFEYAEAPLYLGNLQGNEFEIVLRDVQIVDHTSLGDTITVLKEKGFINYYGMQRFGTSTISTHSVGLALLRDDFKEAVSLIMAPRPGDPEEVQQAREAYAGDDLETALRLFPFYHIPERAILQRMQADKQGRNDWRSYFMAVPRSLRTMYVHAYQSYIWNRMVTERVNRFGLDGPVIGDVVLLEQGEDLVASEEMQMDDGDEEEDVYNAGSTQVAQGKRVKELESSAEVSKYSIHDIVMPLPGNQIQMSSNGWMAQVYGEMLAQDGLTPSDIGSSSTPEFALTGDYRKVMHLPRNVSYRLLRYSHVNANLCQSDEDRLLGLDIPEAQEYVGGRDLQEEERIAMVLRLTLGSSSYATMALREVLKQDTSVSHQKELSDSIDKRRHERPSSSYRNEGVNKIQGKQSRTWGAPKVEAEAGGEADKGPSPEEAKA